MYFLEMFDKTTEILRRMYKDGELLKCKYFHIEDIKIDRSSINFGISLPLPKNPPENVIKKKRNIAGIGISIFIDGKLKIDKYYVNGKNELEIYKIEVDKLDEKRYAITMDSNDNTHIYIETSYLSAGFSFSCVEEWYVKEIEKICKKKWKDILADREQVIEKK